jgi:hypothetical protein
MPVRQDGSRRVILAGADSGTMALQVSAVAGENASSLALAGRTKGFLCVWGDSGGLLTNRLPALWEGLRVLRVGLMVRPRNRLRGLLPDAADSDGSFCVSC